jgi:hypothetical protein
VGVLIVLVAVKAFGLNVQALFQRMSGQVTGIG